MLAVQTMLSLQDTVDCGSPDGSPTKLSSVRGSRTFPVTGERRKSGDKQDWLNNLKNNANETNYNHLIKRSPSLQYTAGINGVESRVVLTLNVSGQKYQTFAGTLARYPFTVLGSVKSRNKFRIIGDANSNSHEFFFDRHRSSFDSILYFYQSKGILKRPPTVPLDIFLAELKFFNLPDADITKFLATEGYHPPVAPQIPKNRIQAIIWKWMELPDSGRVARIVGCFSIFVIVLSTFCFVMETLPEFSHVKPGSKGAQSAIDIVHLVDETESFGKVNWRRIFFGAETACILWFTIEFLLRLITCPNKRRFMSSCLNWVDMMAIAPFYINITLAESSSFMSFTVLRVLRLFRVFRIFKLSRHSRGLRILGETLQASIRELCLLIFFLMIAIILFSSIIYIAETDQGSEFTSIPQAFWYSVVSMTTVGYGDVTPKGALGQLVGSCCAVIGVLVIALPVPVIVENFKFFYRQENRLALVVQSMHSNNNFPAERPDHSCSGST